MRPPIISIYGGVADVVRGEAVIVDFDNLQEACGSEVFCPQSALEFGEHFVRLDDIYFDIKIIQYSCECGHYFTRPFNEEDFLAGVIGR